MTNPGLSVWGHREILIPRDERTLKKLAWKLARLSAKLRRAGQDLGKELAMLQKKALAKKAAKEAALRLAKSRAKKAFWGIHSAHWCSLPP